MLPIKSATASKYLEGGPANKNQPSINSAILTDRIVECRELALPQERTLLEQQLVRLLAFTPFQLLYRKNREVVIKKLVRRLQRKHQIKVLESQN